MTIMPEFTPTEWMLNTHRNKAANGEDWEVYAECVREAMARHGNFLISNNPIREKLAYEEFMYGYKNDITIDG